MLARYRETGVASFQMKLHNALQGPVLSTMSMVLILLNVAAVLLESEMWINQAIGMLLVNSLSSLLVSSLLASSRLFSSLALPTSISRLLNLTSWWILSHAKPITADWFDLGLDLSDSLYNGFETVSVVLFTLEYAARLYTAPLSRKYGKSRYVYIVELHTKRCSLNTCSRTPHSGLNCALGAATMLKRSHRDPSNNIVNHITI